MYNVCTIMYTHIRSQAFDWNCCVNRKREMRKRERSERKGERQGWERERLKEIQGGREKD